MFWKKIRQIVCQEENKHSFSREELMQAYPHRGIALVATSAWVWDEGQSVRIALSPCEFANYTVGHSWKIPGHWLSEMASQAVGLRAIIELYKTIGDDSQKYNISLLVKNGDWVDKPLNTDPNGDDAIIANVVESSFKLCNRGGFVSYVGEVEFNQGEKKALYGGLRVVLKRSADNIA